MKKLEYKTEINATPEKVWSTLWDLENYKKWSSVMNEGAHYKGVFSEGSIIELYDAKNNGMFNLIEKNVPNKEMTMAHKGWIYDGVRNDQGWEDSRETYSLTKTENGTELKISVDALEEFVDFFESNYPKILEKVRQIAEQN